jgi:hypothetical protein
MKLADEFRRYSRRNPISMYYDKLIREMKLEAQEGGHHKVEQIAPEYYNDICRKLNNDGFEVMIYNFNIDNPSHMVYIVWDRERFEEALKDSDNIKLSDFHYGMI